MCDTLTVTYVYQDKEYICSSEDGHIRLNRRTLGNRTVCTIEGKDEVVLRSAEICREHPFGKKDLIFANGYQSWTDTKEFSVRENLNDIYRLPKALVDTYAFDRYGDAFFYPYQRRVVHGYDVGYVKGEHPLFIASYNTRNAYLVIACDVKKKVVALKSDVSGRKLTVGEKFILFDYVVETDLKKGIEGYFSALKPRGGNKLLGYTSWYNHYTNINEEKINNALSGMDERFDLFQIDDGYETFVGDWLSVDQEKFPRGLEGIVKEIKAKGLRAGIWLAPFVAEEKSSLFKEHPDWFLKENGKPVKCGSNWSGFYALDFYLPEVQAYLKEVAAHYVAMGFDFFKLDFLYAVAEVLPENKTRAQVTADAYAFLREIFGEKEILGCGGMLSSAAGVFDYMRVGPDFSLVFDDVFYMRFMHRERISTKVTLQNTIYRSLFDGRWFLSDPDVFLLRDDNVSLSWEQRKAVAIIDALFGSVLMTSDDIALYDEEKKKFFTETLKLFYSARVVDFARRGDWIDVRYRIDGEEKNISYHTKRGIIDG